MTPLSRAAAIVVALLFIASSALAQTAILVDGNAVATGFSGVVPPSTIAPGNDPADLTQIDPNGPSARVIDLQAPGLPPQAQVLTASIPFSV